MLKVSESEFLARFKALVEGSENAATYSGTIFSHKDLVARYENDLVSGVRTMMRDFFGAAPEPAEEDTEAEVEVEAEAEV